MARLLQASPDSSQDPEIVLLFMFVGLFVGSVVTYLLSRYAKGIPYTVVIFVIGAVSAVIDQYSTVPVLGDSLDLWLNLPPNVILYVFLPALLFGEAMTLNPHHVRGSFLSAALLAGPGALLGMYMVAALSYFGLPYGWSWNLSCLFGAILCATDPVAVVALLHRVNASPKLTMLIEGEALLNDGAALVLFNLYYMALEGSKQVLEPGNVIVYFIKVIFISPLLGFLFGLLSVLGISVANRRLREEDKTIQMSITISCAYLSFFFGEYVLGISGVIACCVAGFTISLLGTPLILDQTTMSSVWGAIEWVGNTLLFLIAGLIIGKHAVLYASPSDYGFIIVTYIYVTMVRIGLIGLFFYPLHKYGTRISFQDAIFLIWAGLRGGVSLALVLLLEHSARQKLIDVEEKEGHRIALLAGGFAAITLVFNASTSSMMLRALGLVSRVSDDQEIMLNYARKRLRNKCIKKLGELASYLFYIDKSQVIEYCSALQGLESVDEVVASSVEPNSPARRHILRAPTDEDESDAGSVDTEFSMLLRNPHSQVIDELMSRVRFTFLEVVRHIYWNHIRDGKVPRNSSAAMLLLYSIDIGLDTVNTPGLQDWDQLSRYTNINQRNPRFSAFTIRDLFGGDRIETAVFVLLSFIEAHEEAQRKIPFYLGETEKADTPEEALVVRESQQNVRVARQRLNEISLEVLQYYHSKQAARQLLHTQEEMVEELRMEGILQETDASQLLKEINKDLVRLDGVSYESGCLLLDRMRRWLHHYVSLFHPAAAVRSTRMEPIEGAA